LLSKRIRLTDRAGWLDAEHLGVLLPGTHTAGAWTLAEDICAATMTKIPEAKQAYVVYTYPSDWFSDGNGHPEQLSFRDICPEWKANVRHGFTLSAKRLCVDRFDCFCWKSADDCPADYGLWADGLKRFFVSRPHGWKRVMDVIGSLTAIIVLSPLLILTVIFIKIISPGPIFFKQPRVGYMGEMFTMWKFRTMKVKSDTARHQQYTSTLVANDKPMTKIDHEHPMILFGKVMRDTGLDELPQLINVLHGQMSLIGPRPPIPYEVEEYLRWHKGRFDAVPGMTGLWQVSGKNRLTFNEMIRLDVRYAREVSPWLDMKILLMTPWAIVSQVGDSLRNGQL
jgi:lipopolysaccharide/colanic/teichoic acid biosynthesis glycosyltransferase